MSYRGAGRTLTDREYNAETERVEMAKKMKEINENSDKETDMLGSRVFHFSSLKRKSQTDLAYNATIYYKTFAAKIRIFGRHLK